MSELVNAALGVLNDFRDEVSSWTNQGLLTTLDSHIAQIETAAAQDVHAGETAVKAVFAELYLALHGHEAAPVAPEANVYVPPPAAAPAPAETEAAAAPEASPAPSAPSSSAGDAVPAPADPTEAPSTTEDSSAPSAATSTDSSTPSASATDTPAAGV